MAWAICAKCGQEVHWRATSGAKLADERCPHCGGGLRGKTAGQNPSAGRAHSVVCGDCGQAATNHTAKRTRYEDIQRDKLRTGWIHRKPCEETEL